jgi:2-oxoacid:acceptor oxidoreductase gamma subunit (pyruvate/2-ketoisovalerate family)
MASAPRGLLFGTAGVPLSASDDSTLSAIERIRALGLDCLEIEFVKGVKMGLDTAGKVRERAASLGVRLSVHAPYFINLNSEDAGKRLASQERILKSARVGAACGATSVVFHAAFYGADPGRQSLRRRQAGAPDRHVHPPVRKAAHHLARRDHGQEVAVRQPRRGPVPLPGRRRAAALPRLLAPARPGGEGQFLRGLPPGPRARSPASSAPGPSRTSTSTSPASTTATRARSSTSTSRRPTSATTCGSRRCATSASKGRSSAEIRFHGRGGQGTVVASKILADAIAAEGNYVQAYPEFGVERRGSPVVAFIRIDTSPIYDKSRIYAPGHVVVVDPTLVEAVDVTEGLKEGGTIIINSDRKPSDFKFPEIQGPDHQRHRNRRRNKLGSLAAPIVNTAIVGAVIRFLGLTKLESLPRPSGTASPSNRKTT